MTPAFLLPQAARCKGPQDHLLVACDPLAGGGMSPMYSTLWLFDLVDFDFTFLFFGLWLDHLWNADVKDSVFNFCLDLVSFCVLREKESLTEFSAAEFATDVSYVLRIAAFAILTFLLFFLFLLLLSNIHQRYNPHA